MIRTRLAEEDGFTLVELLAALVVGIIVLFAVFGLLDNAVRLQAKSADTIDTTDRGRLGIDQISQSLASRVCVGDVASLVDARDDHVEFYASLAPESSAVRLVLQRRALTLVGTSIREDVWTASPPQAPPSLPPANSTTPTSTRMIVEGVKPTATTPIFRYYAANADTGEADVLLTTPLSVTDLRRAVMIDVTFTAQGKRAAVGTQLNNQILVRSDTCV